MCVLRARCQPGAPKDQGRRSSDVLDKKAADFWHSMSVLVTKKSDSRYTALVLLIQKNYCLSYSHIILIDWLVIPCWLPLGCQLICTSLCTFIYIYIYTVYIYILLYTYIVSISFSIIYIYVYVYYPWYIYIYISFCVWFIMQSPGSATATEPVVLVHGLGMGAASWCDKLDAISKRQKAVGNRHQAIGNKQ